MPRTHSYRLLIRWTGNLGVGTRDYREYGRQHEIRSEGKPTLEGSADPAFRGDARRYNPEELFVASLSTCHMLWYLHLCSARRIVVTRYDDDAEGILELEPDGRGRFVQVVLHPRAEISDGSVAEALALHDRAHAMCFIANSVNFPVTHDPKVTKPA